MIASSLPSTVEVDGVAVDINTGHRAGVKFTSVLEDILLSDEDKLARALTLYYRDKDITQHDTTALVREALNFYSYDPAEHYGKTQAVLDKGNDRHRKPKPLINYIKDDALIYSAFLQQYGIDLADDEIHWHKFRALLEGLTAKTQLVKVMRYRGTKLSDVSTEERKFYREMQDFYNLEQISEEEANKLTELEQRLIETSGH